MGITWDLHVAYTPGNYTTNVRQIIIIVIQTREKGVEESIYVNTFPKIVKFNIQVIIRFRSISQ